MTENPNTQGQPRDSNNLSSFPSIANFVRGIIKYDATIPIKYNRRMIILSPFAHLGSRRIQSQMLTKAAMICIHNTINQNKGQNKLHKNTAVGPLNSFGAPTRITPVPNITIKYAARNITHI